MTLVDEEFFDDVEDDNKEKLTTDEKDVIIYVDQGLSIVVYRNLKIDSEENAEDWLQKNVFHTNARPRVRFIWS